jgi:hypothetical protein
MYTERLHQMMIMMVNDHRVQININARCNHFVHSLGPEHSSCKPKDDFFHLEDFMFDCSELLDS